MVSYCKGSSSFPKVPKFTELVMTAASHWDCDWAIRMFITQGYPLIAFSLGKMKASMCYIFSSSCLPQWEKHTNKGCSLFCAFQLLLYAWIHGLWLACLTPCVPLCMVVVGPVCSLERCPVVTHEAILLLIRRISEDHKFSRNICSHHHASQWDMQVLDMWIKLREIHSQIYQVTCIGYEM